MCNYTILEVTEHNALKEGLFCIKNPKYPGFKLKLEWLKKRFSEGMKFKLLKVDNEVAGFIEYVPAENAWRPVLAANYLFIHCIWVYPKKNYNRGFASLLINDCLEDAKKQKKAGIVVQVSKGSWMAGSNVFVKNGFTSVGVKDRFELMAFKLDEHAANPAFVNWEENQSKYNGLNLVYAHQCPLFIKSVDEMKQTAASVGMELKVHLLNTAGEAREAPSGYGVYSLVYNGQLLADHYISNTRFKNILNKEL
ncbi:MAG: GNAT family N-acetyltransferase [Bacteroidales bacterium]|nr:GNAT family N-acetyltransferase [Bacteroidales bacterium]MCF8406000.1 GNAT family N-acetyltransferase [Bacteroidales bacterium]